MDKQRRRWRFCFFIKTFDGVINDYCRDYEAINAVYKSLQKDREQADISDIIQQLHQVVDVAIETPAGGVADNAPYDISKIDFDRLRREFERSATKRTTVQNLKTAIEIRLQRLLERNPLRTDFQRHYEQIVAEYNREKDRVTIEHTFETLLRFFDEMTEEEIRAFREGLDEETLAVDLLQKLKAGKLRITHWQDKEATRDAVRQAILDFLWNDSTGLPVDKYSENEVQSRADEVYRHVYRVYPQLPSPFYPTAATM